MNTHNLFEARVEAAAKALYEYETELGADSWYRAFEVERSLWRDEARAALEAADTVVTEEMIAEALTRSYDPEYSDVQEIDRHAARAVLALFRGDVK